MNFKKFRKIRKNAKALSPVIATIILIAVTVAVSVVVAAWMGALTIGFMGNSEQAKISNAVLTNSDSGSTVQVFTIKTQDPQQSHISELDGTVTMASHGATLPHQYQLPKVTQVQ